MIPFLAQQSGRQRLVDLLYAPEVLLFGFRIPLPLWAILLGVAAAGIALHFAVRAILRWQIRRATPEAAERVLRIVERLLPLWLTLALGAIAVYGLELHTESWAARLALPGGFILWVASLFWACAALLFVLMERWAERSPEFRALHAPVRFLTKFLILVIAAVTLLAYFHVDITALVATGAVGGVAVAFALKDTLENFFAGLHLMADRPINEGEMVILHDLNERGTVLRVGWRSTRIRTIDNNILIVPNFRLSSGAVTNLTLRDPRVALRMPVGVAYGSDPDRVAAILEAVVTDLAERVPGIDRTTAPKAFLHPGFGPSSLDFTLHFTVTEQPQSLEVQDAIRREILDRFRAEGIEIPFPVTRVLYEPPR